jgi:L-glutamine-phosphate cytidylyltransferase
MSKHLDWMVIELSEIRLRVSSVQEIEGQYIGLVKHTSAGWQEVSQSIFKLFFQDKVDQLDLTKILQGLIESGIWVIMIINEN